jgi:bifunctional non-homologous end joining protein LigD
VTPAGGEPLATEVAGRRLRLTSLDKVLYPESGVTKAQVLQYVLAAGAPLLRQVANRPLTRRRWPDGVAAEGFFEKALRAGAPSWVMRVALRRSSMEYAGHIEYPLLAGGPEDLAALVWFVQEGALEFHTPQWRIGRKHGLHGSVGPADRMVLDLDPGPPAGLAECAEVALVAREILSGGGFEAHPVASGSKGLHLYVPLPRPVPSDDAVELARTVAAGLAAALPRLVELRMARDRRPGRVFLDVGQNVAAKTTITPYSPRGRAHPYVATPLTWAEVESGQPSPADVLTMPDRLARIGDLLAG